MKLLLDQNLSYRLLASLEPYYPGSDHVHLLGMDQATDITIWNFAKSNNFSILTKDADFYELSLLHHFPPKIIWIKSGNSSRQFLSSILVKNHSEIEFFIKDNEVACLELPIFPKI